jgi:hypothetical protein
MDPTYTHATITKILIHRTSWTRIFFVQFSPPAAYCHTYLFLTRGAFIFAYCEYTWGDFTLLIAINNILLWDKGGLVMLIVSSRIVARGGISFTYCEHHSYSTKALPNFIT